MPPKPKHKRAHDAVNTPPSRDPELMRRMYGHLAKLRATRHGHEAAITGALMGLLPEDTLVISDARGIPDVLYNERRPELLDLAPLDAKAKPLCAEAQIAIAAGYALDRRLREKHGIVCAFVGESLSIADALETLRFAFTHKLPLVVVVQHNLAKLIGKEDVRDLGYEALPAGLPGITVDGTDTMAVYRVMQEALLRARHDGGPTLIECKICPKKSVPARFRPWVHGDALSYMEEQLRARNFWDEGMRAAPK